MQKRKVMWVLAGFGVSPRDCCSLVLSTTARGGVALALPPRAGLLRYAAWPARCLCGGVRLSGQLSGAAACGTAMSPCWGGPSDGQRCTVWRCIWRGHRHLARLSWRPALLPGIRAEPNGAAGASAGGGGEAGWGWRGFLVHTGPCHKPLGWWSPFLSSGLVISHSFHCAGTDRSEPVPKWWSSERNASGALVQ